MKKFVVFVMCLLMLPCVFLLNACGNEEPDVTAKAACYVCIDINPSIEIIVDGDDKVTMASALNLDAEVVLELVDLEGLDMRDAATLIVETSIELGYIDVDAISEEPNAVFVTAMASEGERTNEIKEKLLETVDNTFRDSGVWGLAWSSEEVASMTQEANELGIPVGKYRLITAILLEQPEKTMEELLNASIEELIEIKANRNPDHVLYRNFTLRKEYLESLGEDITPEEQAELDEIIANLEDISALREAVIAQKESRKSEAKEKYEEYLAEKEIRSQLVKEDWEKVRGQHETPPERESREVAEKIGGNR